MDNLSSVTVLKIPTPPLMPKFFTGELFSGHLDLLRACSNDMAAFGEGLGEGVYSSLGLGINCARDRVTSDTRSDGDWELSESAAELERENIAGEKRDALFVVHRSKIAPTILTNNVIVEKIRQSRRDAWRTIITLALFVASDPRGFYNQYLSGPVHIFDWLQRIDAVGRLVPDYPGLSSVVLVVVFCIALMDPSVFVALSLNQQQRPQQEEEDNES